MKKILFFIFISCLFACSNDETIILNDSIVNKNQATSNSHKITEIKALEYANIYFNQTDSRPIIPLKLDYIIDKVSTRSGDSTNDTVAYIFNRGENNGFVIISSDDRVFPILAHSDNGTFVNEKGSVVDIQFTSLIDDYLANNENNETVAVTDEMLSSCYSKSAVVDSFSYWQQRFPYNMALIEEHPDCPVGCVALAAGIVMSHCKSKLPYHDHIYNFAKLIKSLEVAASPNTRGLVNGETGSDIEIITDTTVYEHYTAIDTISQLLYWIGKDVNTIYTTSGSIATSTRAFDLIKKYNYTIADTSGLIPYQNLNAISKMTQGYMLYLDGRNNGSISDGHAWVVDGYYYCVDELTNDTTNAYVHCNWGWGGNWNGYYTGDIFQLNGVDQTVIYNGVRYFAIKKEYEYSTDSELPPALH